MSVEWDDEEYDDDADEELKAMIEEQIRPDR